MPGRPSATATAPSGTEPSRPPGRMKVAVPASFGPTADFAHFFAVTPGLTLAQITAQPGIDLTPLTAFVSGELRIPSQVFEACAAREQTRTDHAREVAAALGSAASRPHRHRLL
jgi:hypothetical protein